ncbi:MAG: hypothetical protein J7K90_06035 [Desulfuromusa sp.]|nr:hypothetical protein [Desulfuromusa sp.]
MKTTLALLIAGLIFLATPMVASADGRRHDGIQNHYKGWVKNDRHDYRHHNDSFDHRRDYRHDRRHNHRYDQRRDHRARKHLRRELRQTRQELRQVKRQIRHNNRRPYYARPYYSDPAVVIGFPHIVFQFDW